MKISMLLAFPHIESAINQMRRGFMLFKQPAIAIAAAALFAVAGAASASAQENCGFAYQRVMEAYQTHSPYYAQMLDHYNARCLSGSSQPTWQGDRYPRYGYDRPSYSHGRMLGGWGW
jgi:hypothetical protein